MILDMFIFWGIITTATLEFAVLKFTKSIGNIGGIRVQLQLPKKQELIIEKSSQTLGDLKDPELIFCLVFFHI